jgi:hypothetical protein
MLDLDAIEARAEAASEGPWSNVDGASSMIHCEDGYVGTVPFPPNAYFIAHARIDIPALVAEDVLPGKWWRRRRNSKLISNQTWIGCTRTLLPPSLPTEPL